MEKVAQYRQYVQKVLREYAEAAPSDQNVTVQLGFDTEHDHYLVINVGWIEERRIYGTVLHLDIQGEKIWIQHDGTEIGIGNELLALDVPKSDIVLAYQSPYRRKYSGFALS